MVDEHANRRPSNVVLSNLEISAGFPLPKRQSLRVLAPSDVEPLAALEECVLRALLRPPCIVSFSGGRDSSLVLAVAVGVARREGLTAPVPVTVRVSGDPDPEERRWQEAVVDHVGVGDWVRVDVDDDLDCIGPVAQPLLRRHGILWPANVHFHVPQFERARGGSVLTGVGGDEIFSRSGWTRVRRVLAGRVAPRPRDALRLAAAAAPRSLRTRVVRARSDLELDWLRPSARSEIAAAIAEQTAAEPVRWRRRLSWLLALRYLELGRESLQALADDWDVEMHHPLLEPAFAAALASLPRDRRFDDRSQALATLFAGLLPPGLASRSSKAEFAGTLWGRFSRDFAAGWDGSGVDPQIVDVDALRRRWQEGAAGPHTLLQALWLATASNRSSASGTADHDFGRPSSKAGTPLS